LHRKRGGKQVKKIFTTETVHPRDRFDYWYDVACKFTVDHESSPACRTDFEAELAATSLADLSLIAYRNSPMDVRRTARQAMQVADEILIYRQTAGRFAIEQNGREALLVPGDLTIIDPRVAYSCRYLTESRALVVKVARRELESRLGRIQSFSAMAIQSTNASVELASAFLSMLPVHAEGLKPSVAELIRDQVLDLVCGSFAEAVDDQRFRGSASRSVVRARLHAVIDKYLTDPDLDPQTVAAAVGVSVRYANSVLADEGSSIMRCVLSTRLACCRKAFDDPAQGNRSISAIAYAWGFNDMTHFARSFKAAFGMSPREYRTARLHAHSGG
jgi:AraC family transcriptional regulator, positive regulator of tynA and feaB